MAPSHMRGRRVFTPGIGGEVIGGRAQSVPLASDVLERVLPGELETQTDRLKRLAHILIDTYSPDNQD